MDVYEALRMRRSVGVFSAAEPPRDVVERVIEAATWAPNHHLTEPWRFSVLRRESRGELARAIGDALPSDRDTDAERAAIRAKLERAPIVIVVEQMGLGDDPVRSLEDYAACACATQNLMLAAHAEGLVTKWSTGKLALSTGAAHHLGIAEGGRIVAFVYIGYPIQGTPPRPPQRTMPEVVWRG